MKRKQRRLDFKTQLNNNAITNLSDYTLTDTERDLLTKGLSYIPNYNDDLNEFKLDTDKFIEKTHTDYHFRDKPHKRKPFYRKTNWQPPTPTNEPLLKLTADLQNILQNTHIQTTTHTDTINQAIHNLAHNPDITIKRADKGGSIVIMNTTDYIDTAHAHLNQNTIYAEQPMDYTSQLTDEINSFILQLEHAHKITHNLAHFITPPSPPRTPLFYFLPKIHKPNNPPRPIISGCDSPTDRISKYLTSIFQPIAESQPTYLKDTKHLLQLIQNQPTLTHDTFLVTADVSSLYTSIPHDEGINAILTALNTHRHNLPPHTPNNTIIKQFLQFILKGNYFDFLNKHYKQIQGTAMGTKMAPPYANIFMHEIEKQLTNTHTEQLLLWIRYIDDILFIWKGTQPTLDAFIALANNIHPTIKFTFEHSKHTANFLDTTIYKDKHNKLQTTIYRKPTNKNLVLHYSSHHPFHLKRNIIYTQALRYKRIISTTANLRTEIATLKDIFTARGYPHRLLQQQTNKALLIPRHTLLTNKTKLTTTTTNKKLTFKIPYHPRHHKTKKDILSTWRLTRQDPTLKRLWPTSPRFLEVTGDKLTDLLVRTKQHLPSQTHMTPPNTDNQPTH